MLCKGRYALDPATVSDDDGTLDVDVNSDGTVSITFNTDLIVYDQHLSKYDAGVKVGTLSGTAVVPINQLRLDDYEPVASKEDLLAILHTRLQGGIKILEED